MGSSPSVRTSPGLANGRSILVWVARKVWVVPGMTLQTAKPRPAKSLRVQRRARAARVHERSVIRTSVASALVMRDTHGHAPAALSAAAIVGHEPHVVDSAVSRCVAFGTQHRRQPTDAEPGRAVISRATERLILRDAGDGQRGAVTVRIQDAAPGHVPTPVSRWRARPRCACRVRLPVA